MRVTVLGKSPAWQDAGGACSGYLVENESTCVLLDCGNGVFAKLRRVRDYTRTDAIVITHMHADHFFDLIPYAFALVYAPRQQPVPVARWSGVEDPPRPPLYLPPGGLEVVNNVARAIGAEDLIERAFRVTEYDPAAGLELGTLKLRFQEVPHFIKTWAIEFRDHDDNRFVFGADCRPNDEIVEFAKDADLLFLESTLPRPERTGMRGHLTPQEAGEHANRAGVDRLVLTHISDELDQLWAKTEAEDTFGGPVSVAGEGTVYVL
ncbi:MAG TPA: MBL fold metallo-hydrolase [Solirubrobacterales bacterium]|jgi:ribonuclease BN (tRNA processing enzyme)|nr:MBL fold metallo-hydrolase [Solirubrobacterales bacterium]